MNRAMRRDKGIRKVVRKYVNKGYDEAEILQWVKEAIDPKPVREYVYEGEEPTWQAVERLQWRDLQLSASIP